VTSSKTSKPGPEGAPAGRQPASKRRYEKPRLTDYGRVSKLTQTGGITTRDVGKTFRRCL
jgi:hypothetical protein